MPPMSMSDRATNTENMASKQRYSRFMRPVANVMAEAFSFQKQAAFFCTACLFRCVHAVLPSASCGVFASPTLQISMFALFLNLHHRLISGTTGWLRHATSLRTKLAASRCKLFSGWFAATFGEAFRETCLDASATLDNVGESFPSLALDGMPSRRTACL